VLPHSAFRGQTPDEMYFGTGDAVPADLTTRAAAARRARVKASQSGRRNVAANEVVARVSRMLATATARYIHGSCVSGRRDRNSASRAVSLRLHAARMRNSVRNARRAKWRSGSTATAGSRSVDAMVHRRCTGPRRGRRPLDAPRAALERIHLTVLMMTAAYTRCAYRLSRPENAGALAFQVTATTP